MRGHLQRGKGLPSLDISRICGLSAFNRLKVVGEGVGGVCVTEMRVFTKGSLAVALWGGELGIVLLLCQWCVLQTRLSREQLLGLPQLCLSCVRSVCGV